MEREATATATAQKRKSPDQETADLCTNGCGFFGTAANDGMCSKCYLEHRPSGEDGTAAPACQEMMTMAVVPPPLKRIKSLNVPRAIGSSSDASSSSSSSAAAAVDTSSSSPANTTTTKQDPPNRCMACRKKVGLTGFRCRCGGTFCGSHRHADVHGCGFDYKAAGREQIAKQNPVVKAAKINKI